MTTLSDQPRSGNPWQPEDLSEVMLWHPFLRGLPQAMRQVLTSCAMPARFEAGETIFHQDDPANRFYVIISGQVRLMTGGRSAVTVQQLGAGAVLGWSWLFPPYRWSFDAQAVEPVRAVFFYGTRLRELCEEDSELGYTLMKRVARVLIDRLQHTRSRWLSLPPPSPDSPASVPVPAAAPERNTADPAKEPAT